MLQEALWIVGIVVFLFLIIRWYNALINYKNRVSQARASIDVYFKMRHDLIPNLVASVKTYMEHERSLLERITEIRTKLSEEVQDEEKFKLEAELSGLLRRLIIVSENYPQLRANENFLQLQNSLFEIEDRLSAARRAYNGAVTDYNNALEMFPTNFIAKLIGLRKAAWFETEDREVPKVQELFK